jgi:3-oxoacyl-[acyl-carrier-protein] synthase II
MAERTAAVAVTGIGVVSPIGVGREQFWSALSSGRSGVGPIESIPHSPTLPTVAAEVRGFSARAFVTSAHLRRMDKFSRMIVAACRMALDDSRLEIADMAPENLAIVVGSVLGDITESAVYLERVFTKGPAAASPMMFPNLVLNASASYAAMELGATGVNLTVAQAEISGEQAILCGCEVIRSGRAEVVLAGGGDELGAMVFEAYRSAGALSGQHGGPQWSSPYDAGRNGIVLGEGSAILVLEASERARARGARVYAEIERHTSFGVPAPLYDWPAQLGLALPPLQHLLDGVSVELICGSANSSRRLDQAESDLFARLGGAADARVTSIKGAIGELGAAGALTTAAACLALHEQSVPPLCHLRSPLARERPRFAGNRAEALPIERALVCGFGRGGGAAALLLRRAV